MNAKRIRQLTAIGLATVAVCSLVVSAIASTKNPVGRPFRIMGQGAWTINYVTGDVQMVDSGETTHFGRYANQGSGTPLSFTGTITTANGDKVFWVPANATVTSIMFIGGTGRFEGITGGFDIVSETPISDTWNEDGTIETVVNAYVGVGTVTF